MHLPFSRYVWLPQSIVGRFLFCEIPFIPPVSGLDGVGYWLAFTCLIIIPMTLRDPLKLNPFSFHPEGGYKEKTFREPTTALHTCLKPSESSVVTPASLVQKGLGDRSHPNRLNIYRQVLLRELLGGLLQLSVKRALESFNWITDLFTRVRREHRIL